VSGASIDRLVENAGLSRLEARALLASVAGRSRAWLIAHGDEVPTPEVARAFEALARRRRDGEPLAYLLGEREFRGLRLAVDPTVLIPRPETEMLVERALELAAAGATLVDLGTGSGAIAIALVHARPDLRVIAGERSPAALRTARRNARALLGESAPIDWREGSWWDVLGPDEACEVAIANPPYIAAGDPHLADLRHEPAEALVSGADGLDDLRLIIAGAPARLRPGGWLLLEHGWDQGAAVRGLLARTGLCKVRTLRDDQGQERVSEGALPDDTWPGDTLPDHTHEAGRTPRNPAP
jgi:release factor glutamine methyltransferase